MSTTTQSDSPAVLAKMDDEGLRDYWHLHLGAANALDVPMHLEDELICDGKEYQDMMFEQDRLDLLHCAAAEELERRGLWDYANHRPVEG